MSKKELIVLALFCFAIYSLYVILALQTKPNGFKAMESLFSTITLITVLSATSIYKYCKDNE